MKGNIYYGYKYLHEYKYPLTVLLDFFRAKYFTKTISDKRTLLDGRRCLLENERLKRRGAFEILSKIRRGEGLLK